MIGHAKIPLGTHFQFGSLILAQSRRFVRLGQNRHVQGAPGSVRVGSVPTGSSSYRFRLKKFKKMKKYRFFYVFQLRNGFWTLPGGPLDPLINIKNPFIFYIPNFFIYFHCFAINDHLTL